MNIKTKAMLYSWLKVFGAAVLTAFVTIVASTQDIPTSKEAWIGILVAGVLAVGPVVINYLNPNDPRYGKGSE